MILMDTHEVSFHTCKQLFLALIELDIYVLSLICRSRPSNVSNHYGTTTAIDDSEEPDVTHDIA